MKNDKIVAFARRIFLIDIVIAGFINFGDDDIYDREARFKILTHWPDENKENLFEFHIALDNEEGNFATLAVYFDKNNKASIAPKPFDRSHLPPILEGNPAFGFAGTWREVISKLREINHILNVSIN
jgi:hypothetical protein